MLFRSLAALSVDPGLTLESVLPLLPLLGMQRDPQDAALLLQLALQPGPLALRRAALEGLAVGLSSWPAEPLAAGLTQLAGDLDPALAAVAAVEGGGVATKHPLHQARQTRRSGAQQDVEVVGE